MLIALRFQYTCDMLTYFRDEVIDQSAKASYDMIDVLAQAEIVSTTNCITSYDMMFAFLSYALLIASMDDMVFWIERSNSWGMYHRYKCRQLTEEQYRCGKQAPPYQVAESLCDLD